MADRTFKLRFLGDASQALSEINKLDGAFGQGGKKMMAVGGALTAGVTAPLVGMAASSLNAAIDFESAFAGVRKTVEGTEAEYAALRTGILDMSKVLPTSAGEIAAVMEAAGALGVSKGNLLEFTEVAVGLGSATNLSAVDAATGLAKLAAITQMPQEEFKNLGSTLVALGNDGASTEADIIAMGTRLAAVGNQVGISEAQILGFAGGLSSMGQEAEAGGTAFSRVWATMANAVAGGGKDLEGFAKVAGMSSEQFATAFKTDAAGATLDFVDGLSKIGAEGGNVFDVLDGLELGEIRVRNALLSAAGAGELLRQQVGLGTKAWEENAALQREVDERNKTTAAQLEMLKNRWEALQIVLGTALIPALTATLEALEPVFRLIEAGATWFSNLDGPMQTVILALGGLVAMAGPVLLFLGSLMTVMGPLGLAGAASVLGPLIVAAFPFLAVGAAVAAIIGAGYLLITHWDEVKAKAAEMWAAIANNGITGSGHAAGGTRSASASAADARARLGITVGDVAQWDGLAQGFAGLGSGVNPGAPIGAGAGGGLGNIAFDDDRVDVTGVEDRRVVRYGNPYGGMSWGGGTNVNITVEGNTMQSDAEMQRLILGALTTANARGAY